ncbi:uncharacterized protein K02A2.6-like, partial [Tachysurus ichikawai]
MNGWPSYVQEEAFRPYFIRRQELSVEQGCVLWGQRVIIPPGYGLQAMDSAYWKTFIRCTQSFKVVGSVSCVFYHLSQNQVLRSLFSAYGLPEELVSDNGPQLVSREFTQFLERNGIKHTAVPAYHPASNGAAERSVQILKRALTKDVLEAEKKAPLPLSHRLANFLLMYRSTPHTVTGRTPAELFLKRQIRIRFSLLKPTLASRIEEKQATQKRHHDCGGSSLRFFQEGDAVCVRNFRVGGDKWNQAKVLKRLGAVTYLVQKGQRQRTVHVDHMLPGRGNVVTLPKSLPSPVVENEPPVTMDHACPAVLPSAPVSLIPPTVLTKPTEQVVEVPSPTANKKTPEKRRYPERVHVPPKKLNL